MKIIGTIVDAAGRAVSGYRFVVCHRDVNLMNDKVPGACSTDKAGGFSCQVDMARNPRGVNAPGGGAGSVGPKGDKAAG
jgi:hypothetical protein